jgi:hypothetical protein
MQHGIVCKNISPKIFGIRTAACLAFVIVGLFGSLSAAPANASGDMAAVFPPWWSPERSFVAAAGAGQIIDVGTLPFIIIVKPTRPGLGARLGQAGALLSLNPIGVVGCGRTGARRQDV